MKKVTLLIGFVLLALACNFNVDLGLGPKTPTATLPLAVVVPTIIPPTRAPTQVVAPTTGSSSLGSSPSPTAAATAQSATATPVPPPPTADGAIYDNFNDAKFNGSINPDLWTFPETSPSCRDAGGGQFSVKQDSGALSIDIRCQGLPYGLEIKRGKRPIEKMRFFESRIKLSKSPVDASGKLSVHINGDAAGSNWSTGCQIQLPGGGTPQINCDKAAGVPLNYGTVYKVRIEINPSNYEVSFFLDDKLLGKYIPDNYRQLASFTPGLTVTNFGDGALGNIQIDDVRVSP